MSAFQLDGTILEADLRRARAESSGGDVTALLAKASLGEGLRPYEMAVLWYAAGVDEQTLLTIAADLRGQRATALETFSPLYLTNTCDAECLMCGMRRSNKSLTRETAGIEAIEDQLRLLLRRGMRAVALLTGEYRAENRRRAILYVNRALRASQALGFAHVLINVGSIDDEEFADLLAGIPRHADGSVTPKLTMCTFQETYSRVAYARFIGTDVENPRADFERRLVNFDRAFAAGMRVANPGVLVGLNADLGYELFALALHGEHLLRRGMEVYVSVPRLRQIAGGGDHQRVPDEQFVRLVALLALGLPDCKIVLTTRENAAMQHRLAPVVGVISSGSSAVAPYTENGARFPLEASQFQVIDQRPFEAVLAEYQARGPVVNFEPHAHHGRGERPST